MNALRRVGIGAKVTAGLAAGILLLASCSGGSAAQDAEATGVPGAGGAIADMEPITLTYASFVAEGDANGKAAAAFLDEIEERTGGKVTFEKFFSASLFPGTETVDAVGSGIADIGWVSTSFHPQELPIANWMLPMGSAQEGSYPIGYLQAYAAAFETFMTDESLAAEFADHNLKVLTGTSSPNFYALCNKPIDSPEVARGMRARIGGAVWEAEVASLGMTGAFTEFGEMYESLQRGVLDCVVNPPFALADAGLWEVAKYVSPEPFSAFPGNVNVMNLDVWNSLSPEIQQIFREASLTHFEAGVTSVMEAMTRFSVEGVEEQGLIAQPMPDELSAALLRHQEAARAAMADNAPAGVKDPAGFVKSYEDSLAHWLTVLTAEVGLSLPPAGQQPDLLQSFKDGGEVDWSGLLEVVRADVLGK